MGSYGAPRCRRSPGLDQCPQHRRVVNAALATPHRIATCKSRSRLKIAVDLDEVLGMFLRSLCQYCSEEHGRTHSVAEFWVYEFAKIWHCDQETSNHIVHEFFSSRHFRDGIPPLPGAYEALQRLKEDHELAVVTSRQFAIQEATLEWIYRTYPDTFDSVHFGNHWAKAGMSRKKSEICRQIGADVLIDDNPMYAYDCASAGMQVLLFNWDLAYPWSQQPDDSTHPNITVVRDWAHVEMTLDRLPVRMLDHL